MRGGSVPFFSSAWPWSHESSFCDVTAYWPLEGPLTKRGCLLEHYKKKKGNEKGAQSVSKTPYTARADGHKRWWQWPLSQWLPTCHTNNTGPIETVFNPSTSHTSQSRSHGLRKGRLAQRRRKAGGERQVIREAQHLRGLHHMCLFFKCKAEHFFYFEEVQ